MVPTTTVEMDLSPDLPQPRQDTQQQFLHPHVNKKNDGEHAQGNKECSGMP